MDLLIFFLIFHMLGNINGKDSTDLSENVINHQQRCQQSGFMLRCNYLPKEIPENVTDVYIEDNYDIECDSETFHSKSWTLVKNLEIKTTSLSLKIIPYLALHSKCFYSLVQLQELHLQSDNIYISETAFEGLDKLRLLDFTGCSRLSIVSLKTALWGRNKVPNLTTINLSQASTSLDPEYLQFDSEFFHVLFQKPITKIDANTAQVSVFNFTEMFTVSTGLKYLNISDTIISNANINGLTSQNCKTKLTSVDASYAKLPADFVYPGKIHLSNISITSDVLGNGILTAFLSTKILNISGIFTKRNLLLIENVTVIIQKPLVWTTEEFIANEMNLRRLDFRVVSGNFSVQTLKKLAMNNNLMDFMHPSFLAIFPNLKTVEVSGNKLHQMAKENRSDFETLLSPLYLLKEVHLSNNGLKEIPVSFFQNNINIETIDLSKNNLEQVNFDLKNLVHLRVLNLEGNNIVRLNANSRNNLNILIHQSDPKLHINLRSNPLSCSTCQDKASIKWFWRGIKTKITYQKLQCRHKDGQQEFIDVQILQNIQRMCQTKVIILVSSLTTGFFLLFILIISIIVYKKRKTMKKLKHRNTVLKNLLVRENMYEYVAFLGYSSDDERFVNANVLNQMNQTLQQITGINRDLVCTGDQCFRPGQMIHNEIASSLDRACTMVIMVTDSYCTSMYCRSEFDQAILHGKPIILMLCGKVNLDLMPLAMKQLYRRNARILWTEENGVYVLKTTWENVCLSILDLVK